MDVFSNMAKSTPSPQILQRAAKAVLAGKCQIDTPTYLKLRRHRHILRKLAAMKGTEKSKKAFITRHRRQVGGIIPFLPLIAKGIGGLLGGLSLLGRR